MDRMLVPSTASPACSCSQRLAPESPVRRGLPAGCRQPGRLSSRQVHCRALQSVGEADFDAEVLQADKPVLIDFWAPWCGPCKLIEPIVDGLQAEYKQLKVVKVNADACKSIVEKFAVYGLPTLLVVKDGKKLEGSHKEGAMQKKMIVAHLAKLGFAAETA